MLHGYAQESGGMQDGSGLAATHVAHTKIGAVGRPDGVTRGCLDQAVASTDVGEDQAGGRLACTRLQRPSVHTRDKAEDRTDQVAVSTSMCQCR